MDTALANPFELLGDDDAEDPALLVAAQQPKAEPKKVSGANVKTEAQSKFPSKPIPPAQAVKEAKSDSARGVRRGGGRDYGQDCGAGGGRDYAQDRVAGVWSYKDPSHSRGNSVERRKALDTEGYVDKSEDRKTFELKDGWYQGYREPAGGGRRGGNNNGERSNRQYDRHSATGKANGMKREGSGQGNCGTQTEEREREAKEMTLKEYEKILEEKRKALQTLKSEGRKVDKTEFESMQELSNKKLNDDVFIKLGSDKDKKKELAGKVERAKTSMSINEFLKPAADGESVIEDDEVGGEKVLNAEKPSGEKFVPKEEENKAVENEAEDRDCYQPHPRDLEQIAEREEMTLEEKRKALQTHKSKGRKVDATEFESMQEFSNKKLNDDVFIKLGSDKDKKKELAGKVERAKTSMSINEFLKPAADGESVIEDDEVGGEKVLNAEKPSGEKFVPTEEENKAVENEAEDRDCYQPHPRDLEQISEREEMTLEEKRKALQTHKSKGRKVDATEFESMQKLSNKKGSEKDKKKQLADKEEIKELADKEEKKQNGMKRVGSGQRNWGTQTDEFALVDESIIDGEIGLNAEKPSEEERAKKTEQKGAAVEADMALVLQLFQQDQPGGRVGPFDEIQPVPEEDPPVQPIPEVLQVQEVQQVQAVQQTEKPKVLLCACFTPSIQNMGEIIQAFEEFGDVMVVASSHAMNVRGGLVIPDIPVKSNKHRWQVYKQTGRDMVQDMVNWAQCVVVVPTSANTLAKISAGFADTLLLSVVKYFAPRVVYIVPDMPENVWASKSNQDCLINLRTFPNIQIINTENGSMTVYNDIVNWVRDRYNAAQVQQELNAAQVQQDLNAAQVQQDLNAAQVQQDLNAAQVQQDPNAAQVQEDPNAVHEDDQNEAHH